MKVAGVDEAGRGSMVGPMVVAGVLLDERKAHMLSDMGVRDSKKLSPKSRARLYRMITSLADGYQIVRVPARSVDASVRRHGLNRLEAKYMARILSGLGQHPSYVDSCDVNPDRFGREISRLSGVRDVRSYHRADNRFVVVSAASILAKVSRDRAVRDLARGRPLGSGYPSDKTTVRFVREYYAQHRDLPAFVRKSWKPVARMMAEG